MKFYEREKEVEKLREIERHSHEVAQFEDACPYPLEVMTMIIWRRYDAV